MIVNSIILEDRSQVDGRRHICERHTDHLGLHYCYAYMAASGFNASQALADRVATLNAALVTQDLEKAYRTVLAGGTPTLTYATLDEAGTYLRGLYPTLTGEPACRVSVWLLAQTDTRLRNMFNMTQQQVNNLRTRLTTRSNALTTMLSQTGE